MIKLKIMLTVSIVLGLVGCGHKTKKGNEALLVYSGAGLTDVISELRDSFQVKYPTKVDLNLASSGTLARQIEHGAAPDIYISASLRWANYVQDLGCVVDSVMQDVCYNDIVIIAPFDSKITADQLDSTFNLAPLLDGQYLAIGNPAHVPVGKYAKESLVYYKRYEALEKQLLMAKDTRSALMTVEMGEAAMGIVYYTDALRSEKVKIIGLWPEQSHTCIRYIASLCQEEDLAKTFLAYITSDKVLVIWEKHGFKR